MNEAFGKYVPGDWSQLPCDVARQQEVGFAARDALVIVIGTVLAKSGRILALEIERINPGDPGAGTNVNLEVEPPFETADDASSAGADVSLLWEDVSVRLFAPDVLPHIDTFVKE